MLSLGKFAIFFAILGNYLYGDIEAHLNKNSIVNGTSAQLIVTAYGENVIAPDISRVGGAKIEGVSSERFYSNINGQISQGNRFRYTFSPDENGTIEPINFQIDGKVEQTNEINFTVIEPIIRGDEPFILKISSPKKDYYLGETIRVDIQYREKNSDEVLERRYGEPSGDGLWQKHKSNPKERKDGGENIVEMSLFLSPQKVGELKLSGAKMNIATRVKRRDSWGFFVESARWNEIVSNSLKFNILPSPTKLIGDFGISLLSDKNEINEGEAINLTLQISGNGNIEDIEDFNLNIENSLVYDEKGEFNSSIANGEFLGQFSQKFAVVLQKDTKIPPFEITFFDPKSGKLLRKRTTEIDIKVNKVSNNPLKTESLNIERGEDCKCEEISKDKNLTVVTKDDFFRSKDFAILTILTFFSGVFVTTAIFFIFRKRDFSSKILKDIFSSEKRTLREILPFVERSAEIKEIAQNLEKKIYRKERIKISKKAIKNLLKEVKNGKDY